MDLFEDFLSSLKKSEHRQRMEEMFNWIMKTFPNLEPVVKWNQPMFTDHGTYIIGFSAAKHHLSVAPEQAGMIRFADEIVASGYEHTKELMRIPWDAPVDYVLLENMIEFNIVDKADCTTFWR